MATKATRKAAIKKQRAAAVASTKTGRVPGRKAAVKKQRAAAVASTKTGRVPGRKAAVKKLRKAAVGIARRRLAKIAAKRASRKAPPPKEASTSSS